MIFCEIFENSDEEETVKMKISNGYVPTVNSYNESLIETVMRL